MEKVDPPAVGRYRVTVVGSEETAGLFRVSLTPRNDRELLEVESFQREAADRDRTSEPREERNAHLRALRKPP